MYLNKFRLKALSSHGRTRFQFLNAKRDDEGEGDGRGEGRSILGSGHADLLQCSRKGRLAALVVLHLERHEVHHEARVAVGGSVHTLQQLHRQLELLLEVHLETRLELELGEVLGILDVSVSLLSDHLLESRHLFLDQNVLAGSPLTQHHDQLVLEGEVEAALQVRDFLHALHRRLQELTMVRVFDGQREDVEVGGHEIGRDSRHIVAVLREAVRQRLDVVLQVLVHHANVLQLRHQIVVVVRDSDFRCLVPSPSIDRRILFRDHFLQVLEDVELLEVTHSSTTISQPVSRFLRVTSTEMRGEGKA
ncbi:hypothetical protein PENTCL1PPCAC_11107, partial [Pristionchus entomophagus]